jgi:mannose-6-phosphate isomerase-like protein (cupin superfamily)
VSRETSFKREPINLAEKLAKFSEQWSPRVIAEMNDYQFKLVKLEGEFVWHDHKDTDEAFLVLEGEMEIGFRDRTVTLKAGELFVVPKGVEHITRAARECHALLIEPRGVVNTGDAGGALTAENDRWI